MMPGHDRGRSRQPRLGVIDIYDLDRQRQLVLLRRDNVEHLLLIGGLNDVVIETNIVRVAGARLPAAPAEAGPERFEPAFDQAPRPQVEPSGRPSIETQLAAQLGSFIKRPSEDSDVDQELSAVASVSAPAPARPEPMLKPDLVTVTAAPSVEPLRPEQQPASFLRAPATPESAPPVRPEPRPTYAPPPFQSRPTPTAPPPPPATAPPAPEIVRASQPAPAEAKTPDAAILSDMAKQLEEALKRPAQPVAPPPPTPVAASENIEVDEDELLVPPPPAAEQDIAPSPPPEVVEEVQEEEPAELPMRPAPEPARPATATPQPVPPPPPPAPPHPAQKAGDPFSVEEIEAEFARLLGRPRDPGNKG